MKQALATIKKLVSVFFLLSLCSNPSFSKEVFEKDKKEKKHLVDFSSWPRIKLLETDSFKIVSPVYIPKRDLLKIANIAENRLQQLERIFDHHLEEKVEILLKDQVLEANGIAITIPKNRSYLFLIEPEPDSLLSHFSSWMDILLSHELTHLIHLDQTRGVMKVLRDFMGKSISPASFNPDWVVEGIATFMESYLTGYGRINSPSVFSYLNALSCEKSFPKIHELISLGGSPHSPSYPYLIGGKFFAYINQNYGFEKLIAFFKDYSASIIPYRYDALFNKHFGHKAVTLYKKFVISNYKMAQNCDQESEIIFSDRQVIYSFPSFLSSRKYGDHVLSLSQHLYSFGKNQLLSLNEPRFKLETGDFYSSRFKAIETNKNLVLKFNMNNGKYFEPYRTFSKNLNLKKTKKFGDFKESIQLAKDLKFTLEKDHLKLNGSSIKKVFVGHGIQRVSENSFLFSGKESSSFSLYLVEQIKKRTKIKKIIGSDGGFFPFFNKNENKIFYSCNLNTSVALCALPAVGGQREVLLQSKGGVFKPIVYKGIAYFKSYHKEGFILSKASLGKKSTILPQKAFLGKMPNSEISQVLKYDYSLRNYSILESLRPSGKQFLVIPNFIINQDGLFFQLSASSQDLLGRLALGSTIYGQQNGEIYGFSTWTSYRIKPNRYLLSFYYDYAKYQLDNSGPFLRAKSPDQDLIRCQMPCKRSYERYYLSFGLSSIKIINRLWGGFNVGTMLRVPEKSHHERLFYNQNETKTYPRFSPFFSYSLKGFSKYKFNLIHSLRHSQDHYFREKKLHQGEVSYSGRLSILNPFSTGFYFKGVYAKSFGEFLISPLYSGGFFGGSNSILSNGNFYSVRAYPLGFQYGSQGYALYGELDQVIAKINRGYKLLPIFLGKLHLSLFSDLAGVWHEKRYDPLWSLGGELKLKLFFSWKVPFSLRIGVAQPMKYIKDTYFYTFLIPEFML